MPIDPRLLEFLRCPACRATVRVLEAETGLQCDGCRRVYPVVDGIPEMLIDKATVPET